MNKNYEDLNGIEKVALFVMVLKAETSAKIFQNMNEHEIELISRTIAGLGLVSNDIVEKVLKDMLTAFEKTSGLIGNIETAKELLSKALDQDKVNSILENITGNVWDKFKKLESGAISDYLKDESPEVISIVISKMNNLEVIPELLAKMPEKKAVDVILNLLSCGEVKTEVLHNLENALSKQFDPKANKQSSFLVEIFNNIDMELEKKLSEHLKAVNPELAAYIKDRLFKFDDIIKLTDMSVQSLIKELEKEDLKIVLRYAEEGIKASFKSNISERVFRIIQSEIEGAEEVQEILIKKSFNRIAATARGLLSAKKISLKVVKSQ